MIERTIRSFVIREGRMTEGQRRALSDYWPEFGIDPPDSPLDLQQQFSSKQPVVVEIGFGMGDSLFDCASGTPHENFVGVEVHRPGIGHLMLKAAAAGLTNLKVINADSVELFSKSIAADSIDRVQVFFPDPWHKKRHHKRRLLNAGFLRTLTLALKQGGLLHIATDWPPYAEFIQEQVSEVSQLCSVSPPNRPVTKYERRGLKLEHKVTDLAFVKR